MKREIQRKIKILKELGIQLTAEDLRRLNACKTERELELVHGRIIRR